MRSIVVVGFRYVDLRHNPLGTFPCLAQLKAAVSVLLSDTQLTEVCAASSSDIDRAPSCVSGFYLQASPRAVFLFCPRTQLPEFGESMRVQQLDLGGNFLSKLPDSLANLRDLYMFNGGWHGLVVCEACRWIVL